MIYITARKMIPSTGKTLQQIGRVRWKEVGTALTGDWTRQQVIDWMIDKGGDARVQDGNSDVKVIVVDATPKYIRTKPDGHPSDNLLSLPTYE